jgi:DNA-binding PadR family transcriptional regulator
MRRMSLAQQAPAATATITTTEAAVLSLLAIEGENSGYDLMRKVSRAIGHVWAPARSQLYAVLPRLVKAGHASRRTVRGQGRPDKQLYTLTPSGRTALDAWLQAEPDSVESFHLKLFVGRLVPPDVLIGHVEWFRRDAESRLALYRAIEPTNTRRGHDFFHYFALRSGIERAEHALRWADWVLDELRRQGS